MGIRAGLIIALACSAAANAQTPLDFSKSAPQRTIAALREITRQLNQSVRSFYSQLDKTLSQHDRGYRAQDGHIVPSADADLNNGAADVMWTTARKFAVVRMLASRNETYKPPALAELDRMQLLLAETRQRVNASTALIRRLMVISHADLDLHKDALTDARREHQQLLRARADAEDAALLALLALPIEQSETSSPEERAQRTWDSLARGMPGKPMVEQISTKAAQPLPDIPLRIERRKRLTVLQDPSYRMAITDSGIEDQQGRHIFYQEEWAQRGVSVIRLRWRVAVETRTGQHIMIKRYAPVELQGSLDDLYNHRDRGALWYLEAADDSVEPASDQLEAALDQVGRARETVRTAAQSFRNIVHDALARQPELDGGMSDSLRETMFAIRAHIAGVASILQAEHNVRDAIAGAELAVRDLEPLAAWFNRSTALQDSQMLERADREIDSLRSVESQATSYLPPDSTLAQDNFPALQHNLIVRIRRAPDKNAKTPAVRCLQEVWGMESAMRGSREVRRTATLILIDPRTGTQPRVASGTSVYKISPDVLLEEIYDEYAADDVTMGS